MKKILIFERSETRAKYLDLTLRNNWDVHILMNSNDICNVLRELRPDALIANCSPSDIDDPQNLEEFFLNMPLVTLVLTNYIDPHIVQMATRYNIGCIMTIPSRIDYITDRVNEMYEYHTMPSAERHLQALGISTALSGHRCLVYAVEAYSKNPTLLMKELYPDAAKACGLQDARCVEHTIRTAIRNAWNCRNVSVWSKYFPINAENDIDLPTNKAFISSIAQNM